MKLTKHPPALAGHRGARRSRNVKNRSLDGLKRGALYDPRLGVYQPWYFKMRLREELDRCCRYGLTAAVIVVQLPGLEPARQSEAQRLVQASRAAFVVGNSVRTVDLAASLSDTEFAICLIHCDRVGAHAAMERLSERLGPDQCKVGSAVYPDDRAEASQMIELARSRCLYLDVSQPELSSVVQAI